MSSAVWITQAEAGLVAPGLSAARLGYLRREVRYRRELSAPPARVLSGGEVIYDELLFRRWLESTVSPEWVYGVAFDWRRRQPREARVYAYQDAELDLLRRRTYIAESDLRMLVPELPLWRIRDLRFRGAGPRFLKPTPRTVVYVAEEILSWAAHVPDYTDRLPRGVLEDDSVPFTPPIGFMKDL